MTKKIVIFFLLYPFIQAMEQPTGSPVVQLPILENTIEEETIEELRSLPVSPIVFAAETPTYETQKKRSRAKIRLRLLETFLRSHVNPRDPGQDVNIALCTAYRYQNYPAAELLLNFGADPNSRDNNQLTPLMHLASKVPHAVKEWLSCTHIPELVEYGADFLSRDCDGNTLLMQATRENNLHFVSALLGTYGKTRVQMLAKRQEQIAFSRQLHDTLSHSLPPEAQIKIRAKLHSLIHSQLEATNAQKENTVTQAVMEDKRNRRILVEITKCLTYQEIRKLVEYTRSIKKQLTIHWYTIKLIEALKDHPSVLKEAQLHDDTEFVTLLSKPKLDIDEVEYVDST